MVLLAGTLFVSACAAHTLSQTAASSSSETPLTPADVARALHAHRSAASHEEAMAALKLAWQGRAALHDDVLIREALKEADAVSPMLAAPQRLERLIIRAGEAGEAASVLKALSAEDLVSDELPRWTATRWELLRASLLPPNEEHQAIAALNRVARLRPSGAIGEVQRAQALLMLGSIEHRSARYKDAIAAFLKVSNASGLWREARLGMAWSQLRIAQPERALASLALLPGGLTGDPERALVAAMAAGALGKVDAALAVIEEARERARLLWLEVEVPLRALREETMALGEVVRLRAPDEGVLVRLAAHPALRLMAAELRAAEELVAKSPNEPAFGAYLSLLEQQWERRVSALVNREQSRVRQALDGLAALEPQLR